ncbi:glucan endo-1,3-beta-glucosidase, basic isoform-like [Andrographis paniculata]|uniref:glucan endo-1,3-beta-glucosidase, basic isoform-like n=1 Tax=Andrographis paniculata TaxID=175694 RepID=UPI0021E6DAD4|nr:glucan endo-1,3-beta-glucosidase, basic isoform-like [Andrographis paniculata]
MEKPFLKNSHCNPVVLTTLTLLIFSTASDAQIGACYGTLGDNFPSPEDVIGLCRKSQISRIRIYNPNPAILQALIPEISVIVGVDNGDIRGIASNPEMAKSWIQNNILRYKNANFSCIAVGNEISPLDSGGGSAAIAGSVVPAMKNIQAALSAAGLAGKIKVSTVLSAAVLGNSYPPSAGVFRQEIQSSYIDPIIQFLAANRGPFLANVYPYFAYIGQPEDIRLDYALFTSPAPVVKDGEYQYQNLFSAIVDAFNAALEKSGGAGLEVVVAETGWPTAGGTATSVENARTYNTKLSEFVKKGTPRKPQKAIETYVFDLIDEDLKNPEYEKHWGLFLPNKNPKYPMSFN